MHTYIIKSWVLYFYQSSNIFLGTQDSPMRSHADGIQTDENSQLNGAENSPCQNFSPQAEDSTGLDAGCFANQDLSHTEPSQNDVSLNEADSQQETDKIMNDSNESIIDNEVENFPENPDCTPEAFDPERSNSLVCDVPGSTDSYKASDISLIAGQANLQTLEPAVAVDDVGAQG